MNHETTKKFCSKGSGYIINKNLLTIIGPHLPFCLATINKNNGENNGLQEDLAIERCFMQYIPMFKGCETFLDNYLSKLHGSEFLYLRPNDVVNWEKYKEPLEVFNDEYMNGWRFADAIVIGEVKDPLNMMALEEWYGKGGKFDGMVEEMGGVIPDPKPIPIPIQEEEHLQNQGSKVQFENTDNVEEIMTIMTIVPMETSSNENEIFEQSSTTINSLRLSTISSEELPVQEKEQFEDSKNIYTTDSIFT